MNKTIAMLILIVIVLLGLGWGVRQYGNSRVAEQELNSVTKVVSEAVAERKEAVKEDVAQTAARADMAREIASVVISHREKTRTIKAEKEISHRETNSGCAGEPERLRVLIDAASEINRRIDSTAGLP